MSDPYGVALVNPGQTYTGAQGFMYGAGASQETVGARQICMNVLPVPPGKRAKAHYHEGIETIAYMIDGSATVFYGERMEHSVVMKQGDHIYIPGGVAHAPYNQSGAPCTILVAHSSGSDQDGIVMLPHLDEILDDL